MFSSGYTAYLGQNYAELKKKTKERGKPFADPEFPANRSSLFFSKDKQVSGPLEWKRPKVIWILVLIITANVFHLNCFNLHTMRYRH